MNGLYVGVANATPRFSDEQPCQFEHSDHHVRHKPDLLGIDLRPEPARGEPDRRLREAGDVGWV